MLKFSFSCLLCVLENEGLLLFHCVSVQQNIMCIKHYAVHLHFFQCGGWDLEPCTHKAGPLSPIYTLTSHKDLNIFLDVIHFMYVNISPPCMDVHYVWASCQRRSEGGTGSPTLGVKDGCEPLYEFLELNPFALQRQKWRGFGRLQHGKPGSGRPCPSPIPSAFLKIFKLHS